MVLEARGFVVETATTASEATQIFNASRFDLVITDHLLGRNTSHGMIAQMKDSNPSVGIIVLSGAAETPKEEGVDAFISKADGPDVLLQKVEEVTRLTRQRRIVERSVGNLDSDKTLASTAPPFDDVIYAKMLDGQFLSKTQALLAAVVQSSDDAIYAKTLEGRFLSWNNAAERMYGYKAEEVIGKPVAILLPPDRPNELDDIMERLRRGEKIEHFETVRRSKDGHLLPVSLTISPIRDSLGEIVAASATARDISLRKMAEEALRSSERLAMAGRLTATLAHEINNPLEAVSNILYLLERTSLDETARKFVQAAEDEIEKIREVTRLTLGLHRRSTSAGKIKISELVDNVLALYKRRIESYGISVDRRYLSPGLVNGVAAELRQVFSNLIVNAVDALHTSGSKLVIKVKESLDWRDPTIHGARITIADDGPGMTPACKTHVFDQFFTTKGDDGTGLGLWVTRGIVQKYSGTIQLRSSVETGRSGTTFSIFIPVSY